MIGGGFQTLHRAAHGQMAGAQNVDIVDFRDSRMGNTDIGSGMNFGGQYGAALFRQFLGIVQAIGNGVRVKHHGGGCDWSGKRAAPDLVHAGDTGCATGCGGCFKREVGSGHAPVEPQPPLTGKGKGRFARALACFLIHPF